MSASNGSAGQPFASKLIRWVVYVVAGVSVVGLILLVTAQTLALTQRASPPPTETAPPAATRGVALVSTLALPSVTAPPTRTLVPPTPTLQPTATAVPGAAQTASYEADCALYDQVSPDLLKYVSKEVALPRDFQPLDLAVVALNPKNVAYRPISLRRVVHQALVDMLAAMNQAGLSIWVMSGYRSYGDQELAYEKWLKLYPERAPDISAVPGHSEHQLGTVVDFSTPDMIKLHNEFFNVAFFNTPEGQWLYKQAADYGFTLSYPAWATQLTGYAYEPWHYRYVGLLARDLQARKITLTQYLHECARH